MRIVSNVKNDVGELISLKDFSNEYLTFHKNKWKKNFFETTRNNLDSKKNDFNNLDLQFLEDLTTDYDKIIKAVPSEITDIINKYTTGNYLYSLFNQDGTKTVLYDEIVKAFDYNAFRKSAKASWLCERLEIKACLYCNAQFTLAVGKNGNTKKLLFELDHFYNQKKYPFLSLTLGNIIPSCSSCNITKSKKEFNVIDNFHPYLDDLSTSFTFEVDEENVLTYLTKNRNKELLKPFIKTTNLKVLNHFKEFRINHVYDKHTDIIEELVLKSFYYNDSKISELKTAFSELNLDDSLVDRFILGNYTLDSEINNRPLSKLSKDIGKQLKIIK